MHRRGSSFCWHCVKLTQSGFQEVTYLVPAKYDKKSMKSSEGLPLTSSISSLLIWTSMKIIPGASCDRVLTAHRLHICKMRLVEHTETDWRLKFKAESGLSSTARATHLSPRDAAASVHVKARTANAPNKHVTDPGHFTYRSKVLLQERASVAQVI